MKRLASITLITIAFSNPVLADLEEPKSAAKKKAAKSALVSGIERVNVDKDMRAQDDFFRHVNGTWLKKTPIPEDKSNWGSFSALREATLPRLRGIIEGSAKQKGSEAKKISDIYASYMNEKALERLALKPLEQEFALIDKMERHDQLPAMFAWMNRMGATAPYALGIHQDAKDSSKYIVDFWQSGLGMPDRDYYLSEDDARLKEVRAKYGAHVEKMLAMTKDANAKQNAKDIVALETEMAQAQWTNVENRDPVKTYNRTEIKDLPKLVTNYDWSAYVKAAGIEGKTTYVTVSQPSYFSALSGIIAKTPMNTWKTYLKWHLLRESAPYMNKALSDEHFAFYGATLRGVPQQEPRWKRGVRLTDGAMGEGLGKLYVAKYFKPDQKARMEKLVANLLEAFKLGIDSLDWMSPATKQEAQAKLATFRPKIGYPDQWRDYSSLKVAKHDLLGNVRRANEFEYERNINKLGKPIDREEWGMTPQTVNAYYNPELNEIVFPAAILEPPFFNPKADDAVNYGGIGAVIGHEISHGFDDQGSQYDGAGNLRNWWTKEDHEKFAAKTTALVKQYNAFSPLPGYQVNGELTLGENIADNSGLAIAYKAYLLSLNGKEAPMIDGISGEQRFFMGFNQVWCAKARDQEMVVRLKTDPHSPPEFRANGTVRNQPGFHSAFATKEGDKMYLPPEERVMIW